jgi:DNA polymerase I-like protein with 3'-5' exonuclease and polymerase domains
MLTHLENCLAFKYIAVDTEGFTAEDILGISIAHPGLQGLYFPYGHRENVNVDEEVREKVSYVLKTVPYRVFHHAGHDLNILPELFDLPFADTMIMAHMVDENIMSKGLDFLHKWYTGKEGKQKPELMQRIIDTMGWTWVPFELMNLYAEIDAVITMELFQVLLALYEEQFGPLWSV